MIKIMVENGATLMKPKRDDGLTSVHFAASNNDIHLLDYIFMHVDSPRTAANVKNHDGWSPCHFAGFLNNFDALNLLIENGGDPSKKNKNGLTSFDEIIRNDHAELLECVWPFAKKLKRDLSKVRSIF